MNSASGLSGVVLGDTNLEVTVMRASSVGTCSTVGRRVWEKVVTHRGSKWGDRNMSNVQPASKAEVLTIGTVQHCGGRVEGRVIWSGQRTPGWN